MASIKSNRDTAPPKVEATEVYGDEGPVRLTIATGGAGQTGLLKALAVAFITQYVQSRRLVLIVFGYNAAAWQDSKVGDLTKASQVSKHSVPPFRVAWLASDTSLSFNALASGAADLSITYHAYAEHIALRQGIANEVFYAWRDNWMLVGPETNPARLPTSGNKTIYELFAMLFQAAVETATDPEPVRYLSRYDKSANNIAESRIWATIGQTPWAHPYSTWYHRYTEFPFGAFRAASKLCQYTLVDRGTWCSIEKETTDRMMVFAESFAAEEDDPLINPAHVLVGTVGKNIAVAKQFAEWLVDENGGQRIVEAFAVHGNVLYAPAPRGVEPLGRVTSMLQ